VTAKPEVWASSLLPLQVWFSPLLRLRFRSSVSRFCHNVNLVCNRKIFAEPEEASNHHAVGIETLLQPVPVGVVYFKDANDRAAIVASIEWGDLSAIVNLPESEESPYSTMDVTARVILELLVCSDLESIKKIYSNNLLTKSSTNGKTRCSKYF